MRPPVLFGANAGIATISQDSFNSPDGSHHVLVAWVGSESGSGNGKGVICSVLGVASGSSDLSSTQIHSNKSTSVSIVTLGYHVDNSSIMTAATCYIQSDTSLYCGWVNVEFGDLTMCL